MVKIRGELIEATFRRRLNRFAALVAVDGKEALAHVPNSGRMRELLYPGAHVWLAARSGIRRTAFDLLMAHDGPELVSIDARLPALLLEEALLDGRLPGLQGVAVRRREVRFGDSRLDLLGEGPDGTWLIEAKSVTLVSGGVALFPDAPTLRGTRHLEELWRATRAGYRAAVAFVVQRGDAVSFKPHEDADPLFAATLRDLSPDLRVLAYRCRVTAAGVSIAAAVPVMLD